jgi:hypothetical protein
MLAPERPLPREGITRTLNRRDTSAHNNLIPFLKLRCISPRQVHCTTTKHSGFTRKARLKQKDNLARDRSSWSVAQYSLYDSVIIGMHSRGAVHRNPGCNYAQNQSRCNATRPSMVSHEETRPKNQQQQCNSGIGRDPHQELTNCDR